MRDRPALKFSPETMALEGRALLTSVTKLPFSGQSNILLNNNGVLVGQLSSPGHSTSHAPFFIQAPGSRPKPIKYPRGDTTGSVTALNDAGQAIGDSQARPGAPHHGFLYNPKGGVVAIPPLPGYTEVAPLLLSEGGLVAGTDYKFSPNGGTDFMSGRNFLYGKAIGLVDMGAIPNLPTMNPAAINDTAGLVVGTVSQPFNFSSSTPSVGHAFVYNISLAKLTDLGTVSGFDTSGATFVNSRGQIAGQLFNSQIGTFHTFIYTAATGMKDIGTMPGFDRTQLVSQMDDGSLLVEATNSRTNVSHAAFYVPGVGFHDLATLPTPTSNNFPGGNMPSLYLPNKSGKALVMQPEPSSPPKYFVLDLATHQLAEITNQISSSQYIQSNYGIKLNDRGEFVVSIMGPGPSGTSLYLVSLNAIGQPYNPPPPKLGRLSTIPPILTSHTVIAMPLSLNPPPLPASGPPTGI